MDELEKLKSALSKVKPEDVHCEGEESTVLGSSDTIDISGLDLSYSVDLTSINTSILSGGYGAVPNAYGNITINSGNSGSFLTSAGSNGAIWSSNITTSATPSLNVSGDAEFEGDVKIKGVSIAKALEDIQSRLAILVPDPKKLEQFDALKKAYEHYKTLEALCQLPTKEEKE